MKKTLQIANVLGLLMVLVVNYLSNALPINGRTAGELSDLYPNFFVPAGFTFAIWGVIYLLLSGFVIYQARDLFADEQRAQPFITTIGWLFVVSCFLNAGWLFAWHYQQVALSVLIMLSFLTVLILIYRRLNEGESSYRGADFWLVKLPFSVYLGWISVATIANVSSLLVRLDWSGFGISGHVWAMVMIGVATVLGILMLLRESDIGFALVLIWAFFGIMSKNQEIGLDPGQSVALTAIVGMVLLMTVMVVRLVTSRT